MSELDDAYLEAKHAWSEAMRASGRGTGSPAAVTKAQAALERADEDRRRERERIDALRDRLHDQRRREILMRAVSGQDVARTEVRRHVAEKDSHRSLLSRLFGRRSD